MFIFAAQLTTIRVGNHFIYYPVDPYSAIVIIYDKHTYTDTKVFSNAVFNCSTATVRHHNNLQSNRPSFSKSRNRWDRRGTSSAIII